MESEEIEFAVAQFEKTYDNVFSHIAELCSEKIIINDPVKKCRFCDKSEPEVSFKRIAHAIPELIGNKKIFTNNECDSCNEKFSLLLEDSLGKYLGMWRTLMQIKGKTGIVSYKAPDGISRIDFKKSGLELHSYIDNQIIEINEEEKTITIKGYRQPYTPIAVYKCFVKMVLSVIPYNLLGFFDDTKRWLLEDSHEKAKGDIRPILTISSSVPGNKPFGELMIIVMRRKDDIIKLPFMQMAIFFGNMGFQIIVPCKAKDFILNGQKLDILTFPHPAWITNQSLGKVQIGKIDLSGKTIVKNEPISVTMGYGHSERIIENGSNY